MRLTRWLLPLLLLVGSPALAQQQVQPMVLTGTSPPTTCAVGGGTGTACPVPVTLSGTSGGTVTANQGTPNAGGVNAWPVAVSNANANGGAAGSASAPVVSSYSTAVYSGNVTNTPVAANAAATIMGPPVVYNGNTAVCYLQFFNVASGSVTLGVTVPLFSIGIPANGGGTVPIRYKFSTALTIGATTTRAGSTACTNGIDTNLFQD